MRLRIFALVAFVAGLFAATASAQVRYGVIAGANFTDLKFKQEIASTSMGVGEALGVQGEMIIPGIGFGFDFGLMYNQTGATVNLGDKPIWSLDGYGKERVYLHNVCIPFHIRLKWQKLGGLEEYCSPIVYAGPEFNIQVGHSNIQRNGTSAFKYAGGDVGISVGVGFEVLKQWQITGAYTWGMTYALRTTLLENYSARNRGWNVRVGYFF
jgi:hypothetical protein